MLLSSVLAQQATPVADAVVACAVQQVTAVADAVVACAVQVTAVADAVVCAAQQNTSWLMLLSSVLPSK
jgi:hypothetical protein